MTERAAERPVTSRPDRASWPDWLLARIEALPGPWWAPYPVAFVAIAAAGHGARWVDGLVEPGTFVPIALVEASLPVLVLAIFQGLNRVAVSSLRSLKRVLPVDEPELAALARDLTRTPAGGALVALVIGIASGGLSVMTGPAGYGLVPGVGPVMTAWEYALAALIIQPLVFAFAVHTIHQQQVVIRIHRLARVDLFVLDPLYSFAVLTSWTGIAILTLLIYGVGTLSLITPIAFSAVDYAAFSAFFVIAIASFLVPLLGLHGRIEEEKDRRKAVAGRTLNRTLEEVDARVAAGTYEGMPAVNDAVAAATSTFNTISRVSTWPWRPDTLRGFVGALGLPILIYAITAILARFL